MKKLIPVLIFFLAMSDIAFSYQYFEPYTKQDWIMESIFVGLVLVDWKQTSDFVRDGKKDSNPCIRENADQNRVNRCITSGIILHALIVYAIPKEFRSAFEVFSIILESVAIYDNCRAGYCMKLNIGFNF